MLRMTGITNCEFKGYRGDWAQGPGFISAHSLHHGHACSQEAEFGLELFNLLRKLLEGRPGLGGAGMNLWNREMLRWGEQVPMYKMTVQGITSANWIQVLLPFLHVTWKIAFGQFCETSFSTTSRSHVADAGEALACSPSCLVWSPLPLACVFVSARRRWAACSSDLAILHCQPREKGKMHQGAARCAGLFTALIQVGSGWIFS